MSILFAGTRFTGKVLIALFALLLVTWRGVWYQNVPLSSSAQNSEIDSIPLPDEDTQHLHAAKVTSKIAKVTVAVNSLNSTVIQRALRTHQIHNDLHGYQHFIGTDILTLDYPDLLNRKPEKWNKPAYLLQILFQELAKPPSERLEWLYWFDADTIIMNPHIKLETFLPPADPTNSSNPLNHIQIAMASNWDGLNSGVFPIRVHPWSISFLSAIYSWPRYHPIWFSPFADQAAFSSLLNEMPPYEGNWTVIPHRWFNSLPINYAFRPDRSWVFAGEMTPDLFDNGEEIPGQHPWKVMKGDMVVHFAGAGNARGSWMNPWMDRAERYLPEWANSSVQERLELEAAAFWRDEKKRLDERMIRLQIQRAKDVQDAKATWAAHLKEKEDAKIKAQEAQKAQMAKEQKDADQKKQLEELREHHKNAEHQAKVKEEQEARAKENQIHDVVQKHRHGP